MKIISWNVNGIKSKFKSGNLEDLIKKENPDIYAFRKSKRKMFRKLMDIHFTVILHLKIQGFMELHFIPK